MKNVLTFTKNNENILSTQLNELEENLNNTITDLNYSFFVLDRIAAEHTDFKIIRAAKKFTEKQVLAQDELDYLNSCIVFLKRQLTKVPAYHTLTETEIAEQMNQLAADVNAFVEKQITMQKYYFQFADKYFQDIAIAA